MRGQPLLGARATHNLRDSWTKAWSRLTVLTIPTRALLFEGSTALRLARSPVVAMTAGSWRDL